MMVLKKKTIIVLTLVVLIVAAGYISTKYGRAIKVNEGKQSGTTETTKGKTDTVSSAGKVAEGYFIDVQLGRENARSAQKQDYTDIINNDKASKTAKTEAEEKLMKLIGYAETEMRLEALIKSKGYEDAIVLLSDESANVTVRAKTIAPDQVDIIKNIVCRESKLPASQVMVQPKE